MTFPLGTERWTSVLVLLPPWDFGSWGVTVDADEEEEGGDDGVEEVLSAVVVLLLLVEFVFFKRAGLSVRVSPDVQMTLPTSMVSCFLPSDRML